MAFPHLEIFNSFKYAGAQKPPKRWDDPDHVPQKLLSRDFILLFLMAMCSNSFIAVYYCFEPWLEGLGVTPGWRGVLLSALFAMILIFRPLTSVVMLRHGKLWPMTISLAVCALVMSCYPFIGGAIQSLGGMISAILILRLVQGAALAIYSACTIGVLVECIPPGQSARGFAIFSLTMLLPYSIIPALSEEILPSIGGEAALFGYMAWLGLPSFAMLALLRKKLKKPEISSKESSGLNKKELMRAITHSGLGLVYGACLFFSIMTVLAVFYMKGLSKLTGDHPAAFFTSYSLVIILVRVFGSRLMDTLPRHKVTVFCSAILALSMLGFVWAPGWAFIPLSCAYGFCLGLVYPLLAAAVYDRSSPETRSINSNIMMATFDASGMLAPILGGIVISQGFGYKGVFTAAAVSISLCGLCMLADALRVRRPKTRWGRRIKYKDTIRA